MHNIITCILAATAKAAIADLATYMLITCYICAKQLANSALLAQVMGPRLL